MIAFSSSTLKLPTGIFEGVTGFRFASFSFCLVYKKLFTCSVSPHSVSTFSMNSQCFFSSSRPARRERASSSLFSVSSSSSLSQSFSSWTE